MDMMSLLKKIYPMRMAPVSAGLDQVVAALVKELPFKVREYPSLKEYNGWIVPQKWEVKKAQIHKGGKLIYDGALHPLGVIGYSQSFSGKVSLEELKKHLFFTKNYPDGLVYHCDLYYKSGQKNWGFCMPLNQIESLEAGDYDVDLQTVHEKGTMKVADYFLKGKSPETIFLNAHSCHAGQANDDVAGIVVAVEVMKRLAKRKNRFSYRLIVAPEHFGTVFYLAGLSKKELKAFKCGMFLEMLGSDTQMALQETFTGEAELDRAAHHYLRHAIPDHRSAPFRGIVGNDETVWEAPGYEVPTISLSRFPYPEYHSSNDTHEIIKENRLEESVLMVLGILDILETNRPMKRKFTGLVALSNPKYDLYISTNDPSIRPKVSDEQKRWNRLMDYIPRYFDGKMTVLDIAVKHDLPYADVLNYVRRFEAKGLIQFVDGKKAAR